MKTIARARFDSVVEIALLAALVAVAFVGCMPEFDDPTMAVLKKPEIISVVLDPPEAAPGETVTASFLMADERGVIDGRANLWLPAVGGDEDDPAALIEGLAELGLELDDLAAPTLELTVGPAASYVFDEDGFAGQPLTLFAAARKDPDPETPAEQLLGLVEQAVEDERMELAIRTLVVSQREDRNRNPRVLGISFGSAEVVDGELDIARSDDEDLSATRQYAADHPLVIAEKTAVWFHVEAEDDDGEDAIRYQWISTGGDFGGLRERVQKWKTPKHRELADGDLDQTGMENVNPRKDPNLHPVFVIVRDDLAELSMGQVFAEFYVRIVPAN